MRHVLTRALVLLFRLAGALPAAAAPVTGTPASLAAPDGTKLAATYYSGSQPGPGILLLHQCNRDRSSWNALAEALARKGFHVLTVDYRGYGQSGGARHLELPGPERVRLTQETWPGDIDVAFSYLKAQPGVRGVFGAGGASCGVNQSIQLSKRHPDVKSLVLLSGSTDRAGRTHLKDTPALSLLTAAADDDGGAVEIMEWIDASSANPSSKFIHYKSGGHGTDLFKPHPDLPVDIVAWYEATLSGKAIPAASPRQRVVTPTIRLLLMMDEPGGAARAVETLKTEQKKDPRSPLLQAGFLNQLGYIALQSGDTAAGVAIMRFNTELHPASSNAWDSLGDAYLADGQREKAREASEKSLKLVDADKSETEEQRKLIRDSAQGKLNELKAAPAPK
jgi:dienelactone hydrolase